MRPTTGVFQLKGQAPARIFPPALSLIRYFSASPLSLSRFVGEGRLGFACEGVWVRVLLAVLNSAVERAKSVRTIFTCRRHSITSARLSNQGGWIFRTRPTRTKGQKDLLQGEEVRTADTMQLPVMYGNTRHQSDTLFRLTVIY
jgi:hypothetical protein